MKRYKKRLGADARRAIGRAVSVTAVLAAVAAAIVSPAAYAQVQTFNFNIEKQPLSAALLAFGRQADVSVLAPTALIEGKTAPEVRGQLSASAALDKLLEGTGLTYVYVESNAIKIFQKDQAQLQPLPAPRAEAETTDRVIVTGSTIKGVPAVASPIETYTSRDITRSGATTTEQFVGKLPQNLGTLSQYGVGSSTAGPNFGAVTAIDLRGLGIGTTLTLLDGHRMALSSGGRSGDVSFIPLSAIDRVEVLTDGASAIYGSDAVGGVVNFILRDDYEGAETRLSQGGVTSGGLRQTDASQTFGTRWSSGHALVDYDFHTASALTNSDRPYSAGAGPGNLTPVDTRHNLFLSGSQSLTDQLTLKVDLGGAWRKVKESYTNLTIPLASFQTFGRYQNQSNEIFGTADLDYDITSKLSADVTASYSSIDTDATFALVRFNLSPPLTTTSDFSGRNTQFDVSAKLSGSLFALPGGDLKFSLGGGVLEETYKGASPVTNVQSAGTLGRHSLYAFGEIFAPLIGPQQKIPLVHQLSLSLAARYTDYQDASDPRLHQTFGDSTDPKIGLLWSPIDSLNLRGTYGSSFRAPSLTQLDKTGGLHYFAPQAIAGSPAIILGLASYPATDLSPETAHTYTFGADYKNPRTPGLRIGATYYSIDYTDRIGTAPTGGLDPFATPNLLPDLVYKAPSAAFIEDALRSTRLLVNASGVNLSDLHTAAATLFARNDFWIYDNRFKNLALSRQDGLDLSIDQSITTGWGEVQLGLNATHILSYKQQGASTSPVVSAVNVPGEPIDWRGRAFASLSRGGFNGTLSVNYTDAYQNRLAAPGRQKIESWTTADLSLTYDFKRVESAKGLRASLSIQNLFDTAPPFLQPGSGSNIIFPVGFDPANANPLGRFIVLGLTKAW